jgi:hypothetical protein
MNNTHPYYQRFKTIISDPTNDLIKKVPNAGFVRNGIVTMYNGIKVYQNCYYDSFSDIFWLNKGIHEPQEEYVFNEIISKLEKPKIMVELGSYWSFYSLSMKAKHPDCTCYCVEPSVEGLDKGKQNFKLNSYDALFFNELVGDGYIMLNNWILPQIDVLHSDIQGYELEMLHGASKLLYEQKINYIFLSLHTQDLFNKCLEYLKTFDYHIIFQVDMINTFCEDGIIVASSPLMPKYNYELAKRTETPIISDDKMFEIFNNAIKNVM